jgi:hypothetical protein
MPPHSREDCGHDCAARERICPPTNADSGLALSPEGWATIDSFRTWNGRVMGIHKISLGMREGWLRWARTAGVFALVAPLIAACTGGYWPQQYYLYVPAPAYVAPSYYAPRNLVALPPLSAPLAPVPQYGAPAYPNQPLYGTVVQPPEPQWPPPAPPAMVVEPSPPLSPTPPAVEMRQADLPQSEPPSLVHPGSGDTANLPPSINPPIANSPDAQGTPDTQLAPAAPDDEPECVGWWRICHFL